VRKVKIHGPQRLESSLLAARSAWSGQLHVYHRSVMRHVHIEDGERTRLGRSETSEQDSQKWPSPTSGFPKSQLGESLSLFSFPANIETNGLNPGSHPDLSLLPAIERLLAGQCSKAGFGCREPQEWACLEVK